MRSSNNDGERPLAATVNGVLRGLTNDGVPVDQDTKMLGVNPCGRWAVVLGIGQRPSRSADCVIEAVPRSLPYTVPREDRPWND